MTELNITETHRMDDGTEYRAVLARDTDPEKPYDDGAWPIFQVSYRHYDYVAEAFNGQAEPFVDKFNELFERIRELRVWERYAKIFLGASQVHEWGFTRSTDYAYIAFDAKAWRKAMGFEDGTAAEELAALERLANEKPLSEVQAWCDGDVWGRAVQTRYNPDEDLDPDEGWTDIEDYYWVWGFYGLEWAEKEAKEQLADAVSNHKVVHRYTEHEKIAPHERDINAILSFLETPGPSEIMGRALAGKDQIALCRLNDKLEWWPVTESKHQQIVFEHFGIDYKKIEEERELMFKRLQMDASIQAGLSIKKSQEATDK